MIFCITQPVEKYNAVIDGYEVGLWETYGHNPDLFNLLSRTAPELFQYEQGFESVDPRRRAAALNRDHVFSATLEQKVGERTVREILQSTTPRAMLELFEKERPTHLDLLEYCRGYSGVPPPVETVDDRMAMVLFSMKMRALQYEKYSRGRKAQSGNIIVAKFATNLAGEDGSFLQVCTTALLECYQAWSSENPEEGSTAKT